MRLDRSAKLWLGLILLLGLGLRLWGIGFAASTPVGRPDEEIFGIEALAMFVRPYNRLATGWPDLAIKVYHAVLWLERGWFRLRHGPGVNLACLLAVNPIAFLLPVRVVSALLGTATAWLAGRTAAELAPERAAPAALWATAFYAFNYLVGRDGHFAVTDPLLCLFVALTLLCCLRAVTRSPSWLVGAAFAAGTAFSVKYSAFPLALPCLVAAVASWRRFGPAAGRSIVAAAIAAPAGVLIWSPDIVSHWSDFRAGLGSHLVRYEPSVGPPGALVYLTSVLPTAFGWLGLLLSLGGLGWCLRARRGASLVVYVLVSYACVLGPLRLCFARYASPLCPALAATAGVAAAILAARLSARLPPAVAVGLIAAIALGAPAARLVAFDRLLARADTRDLARDWLAANAAGKVVLTEGIYAQVHGVDANLAAVCRAELPSALWRPVPILPAPSGPLAPAPGDDSWSVFAGWRPVRRANRPARAGLGEAGWEELGFLGAERFPIWERDQRAAFTDLRERRAPDLLARAQGARAIGWGVGPSDPLSLVDGCWRQVARFSPGDQEAATWDVFDKFLVPLSNLGALERPGPRIEIYENVCKATGKSEARAPG